MVSGLLAAVAALLTAIFAIAAPSTSHDAGGNDPAGPVAPSAVDADVGRTADELRSAIRAMVDDAIAGARVGEPAATLRPDVPDVTADDMPATGDDGCERDHASGDGWQRTEVRCVQQSGSSSSVSVSSSSSVTVQETSSD